MRMDVHEQRLRGILDDLHKQATARLDSLLASLATLTHDRESSNDDDEHDPEGVTLSSEWSRLTGLVDAARSELVKIDDAIERLDAGTYGICASCNAPIPSERLEVRPCAELCVSCAGRLGS